MQTTELFFFQDWLKHSYIFYLTDWIYCINPFSHGKTSCRFDLAPTLTFMHHLFSLCLTTVILSAWPSSSLHSFTYYKSIMAVTRSGNGPRALIKTGNRICRGTVHFVDLIDKYSCWAFSTELRHNLVSHLCNVQNVNKFFSDTKLWCEHNTSGALHCGSRSSPPKVETEESTLLWQQLHWPASFQSFRWMWTNMAGNE